MSSLSESTLGHGRRRYRMASSAPHSHSIHLFRPLLGLWVVCVARTATTVVTTVSAFSVNSASSSMSHSERVNLQRPRVRNTEYHPTHQQRSTYGRMMAGSGRNQDGMTTASDSFSELTSALALASDSTARNTRWERLVLPQEEDDDDDKQNGQTTSPTDNDYTASPPTKEDYVWILEPADVSDGILTEPSCTIVFTGGAGLGQYPHVAYNELFQRISNKLNAVVVAAPYTISLDHFALAKDTGEKLRRGVIAYDRRLAQRRRHAGDAPSNENNEQKKNRPIYALAHSLGCKLQTIYLAATRREWDGYAFMAFNNFGFSQTIKMARSFTEEIRRVSSSTKSRRAGTNMDDFMGDSANSELLSNIFDFAEMALGVVGIDFSPNAEDTSRLIQLRYNEDFQAKTRLFVMDDDNMDSSSDFIEDCRLNRSANDRNGTGSNGDGVTVSGIAGGHLAPVFFQWNVDDATNIEDLPPEAREMAREAMGDFKGASFGDEVALDELVEEFCNWTMGRGPTRGPTSASPKDSNYRMAGN